MDKMNPDLYICSACDYVSKCKRHKKGNCEGIMDGVFWADSFTETTWICDSCKISFIENFKSHDQIIVFKNGKYKLEKCNGSLSQWVKSSLS